jgi:hypothetical protein
MNITRKELLCCKFGSIYLVRGNGLYKIGYTGLRVRERLGAIRSKSPYPVFLVDSFESRNTIKDEAFLHLLFDSDRITGEWFDLPAIIVEQRRVWFRPWETETVSEVRKRIEKEIFGW